VWRDGAWIWQWRSGSYPNDAGWQAKTALSRHGVTEEEKKETRFARLSAGDTNHHALQKPTVRRSLPSETRGGQRHKRFKCMTTIKSVHRPRRIQGLRSLPQAQGFNWINMIAAFPNWETDDCLPIS